MEAAAAVLPRAIRRRQKEEATRSSGRGFPLSTGICLTRLAAAVPQAERSRAPRHPPPPARSANERVCPLALPLKVHYPIRARVSVLTPAAALAAAAAAAAAIIVLVLVVVVVVVAVIVVLVV